MGSIDVNEIFGWVMLGLLGVLIFQVISSMLWGMKRGGYRSLIRLGCFVVFALVALWITPLVSHSLLNIKLPVLNESLGSWLMGYIEDSGEIGANAVGTLTGLKSFVENAPIAIINIVVFILLLGVFKVISWVAFAIISKLVMKDEKKVKVTKEVAVPIESEDGEKRQEIITEEVEETVKLKRNKWAGLGVGFVQGLVIIFFFMIPLVGAFQMIDAIDKHGGKPGGVSAAANINEIHFVAESEEEEDSFSLQKIFDEVSSVNGKIQKSPFGVITKITGMQAMSKPAMNYLMTVKTTHGKVVLSGDIVKTMNLVKDVAALQEKYEGLFKEGADYAGFMQSLTAADIQTLEKLVDAFFQIDLVQFAFKNVNEVIDFVEVMGWLDNINLFTETEEGTGEPVAIKTAEEPDPNVAFRTALLNAMREFADYKFIREDIKTVLWVAYYVFEEVGTGTEKTSIYNAVKELADNFNVESLDTSGLNTAFSSQAAVRGTKATKENVNRIFHEFFNLNIFVRIISNPDVADVYRVPIAYFMKVEKSKIFIIDSETFDNIADDLSDVSILALSIVPEVMDIVNGGDPLTALIDLKTDDPLVTDIIALLDKVTNEENGISLMIRKLSGMLMDKVLDRVEIPETPYLSSSKVDTLLEEFKTRLAPLDEGGTIIPWADYFGQVQNIMAVYKTISDGGELDLSSLSDLLDLIAGDELLAEILGGIIEDMLNDMLDGLVEIEIDSEHYGDFIAALAGLTEALENIAGIISGEEFDTEGAGYEEILDLLGGLDAVEALANIGNDEDGEWVPGVVINLDESLGLDETAIANLLDPENGTPDPDLYDKVLKLFGLG